MQLEIAQSTPTAASIARLVGPHYAFGPIVASEFLRRSFNQVYRLDFADGRRAIARLCSDRPRGGPNLAFEAEALAHWSDAGCAVARCLPTAQGEVAIRVPLPEGARALCLFEYLEGEATSDKGEDIQAFACGLAALHSAGHDYRGVASAYTLDGDYLLLRPLQGLLQASTMTAELGRQFEDLATRLHRRIVALGPLAQVLCHGDAHGSNNFVLPDGDGQRTAVFFDFDEAGPGYLAYELAVYPWNLYPRTPDGVPSAKVLKQWQQFIRAYRAARPVADVDLAAIAPFMAVRQFWLLGEYAGRVPVWGSQAMPTDYLRRQVDMLRRWETLELDLAP
jgi:Ser/Thr protein kinase RdoA (MazF antagonist)